MALRVVVYERKSSKDRDERQKHSIERQNRDIEEFVERFNGIEKDPTKRLIWKKKKDVDWFYEDASAKVPAMGLHGKKAERPKFLRMIQLIRENRFDLILCTDLSRLSRNATDNGTLVQLLDPYDLAGNTYLHAIRTLDKGFSNSPTDKFTLSLFLNVAKYENDQRSANTKSGLKNKRAKGGTGGRAPLGYKNCGTERGEKSVEADEPNFTICRELWEMLLSGKYRLEQIYRHAQDLNLRHAWNKKQSVVSSNAIRSMFSSQYYSGKVRDGYDKAGEVSWIAGAHPAMVSEEEFWEAQMVLQKLGYRHQRIQKAVSHGRLISSIMVSGVYRESSAKGADVPASVVYEERTRLRCSKCGHRFYSTRDVCNKCSTPINEHTSRYRIQRFYHGKKARKSVALDKVIHGLEVELSQLHITDRMFVVLREQLYTLWLKEQATYNKESRSLEARLTTLKRKRRDLTCKKVFNEEENSDVFLALEAIEEQHQEVEGELRDLRAKHDEGFERAWQRLQILRDCKHLLKDDGEFEPKKSLLLSLCSNLVLHEDRVEVEWREPFDILVKAILVKHKKAGETDVSPVKSSFGIPVLQIVRTLLGKPNACPGGSEMPADHTNWFQEVKRIKAGNRVAA